MALRNPSVKIGDITGLDAVLLEISTYLKTNLSWLTNSYGNTQMLVKEVKKSKINYPAVYVGNNGRYLDLLPDGHLGNYCFFKMNDPEIVEYYVRNYNRHTVNYDLIFWFNLSKIYPSDQGRNVENVQEEIITALRGMVLLKGSFNIESIYKDAKNVFIDYTVDEVKEQFMMHPYGALKFSGEIIYTENC